jgi:hypothetical protein
VLWFRKCRTSSWWVVDDGDDDLVSVGGAWLVDDVYGGRESCVGGRWEMVLS